MTENNRYLIQYLVRVRFEKIRFKQRLEGCSRVGHCILSVASKERE